MVEEKTEWSPLVHHGNQKNITANVSAPSVPTSSNLPQETTTREVRRNIRSYSRYERQRRQRNRRIVEWWLDKCLSCRSCGEFLCLVGMCFVAVFFVMAISMEMNNSIITLGIISFAFALMGLFFICITYINNSLFNNSEEV